MKIIFLGTPDFAVESLKALVENNYTIVAVITAPDKLAGRGMLLKEGEVKKYAQEKKLPILQPTNLKDPHFIQILKTLNADLQIVVAFRMLPEIVWNMPPLGTINVHASLLPKYRGAAPIHWAVINGEKETGVSTFKLRHEIDTGDILLQRKIAIPIQETMGELYTKLKKEGALLLLETLEALKNNPSFKGKNQTHLYTEEQLPLAPKIKPEDALINFNNSAFSICNLIRGLNPFPVAHTFIKNKLVKIFVAEEEFIAHQLAIGTIQTDKENYLKIACKDGFIVIHNLLIEGKKRMDVKAFLKGNKSLFE